jgi:hypothetical protein
MIAHYTRQARKPGWYAYSRREVHQLDSDKSGLYTGLRAAVAQNLAGFVVSKNERGEWWLMLSEAERGVEIFLPSEPVAVVADKRGRK